MRRGISTIELMVGLVIAGVLSASIGTLLLRQQRFYAAAALTMEHRVSLRDATAILPAELRALSPAGGDVLAVSDSSMDIRAHIGAAVVCEVAADGASLVLVPAGQARSTTLAAFSMRPQPGDVALVYDLGVPDDSLDDRWITREVANVGATSDACTSSALIPAELAAGPRIQLVVQSALSPTVAAGAFVHVVRRVRYRLYRASTGDWYLGYSEWDGAGFTAVQPVSGPFASYSRVAASSGLHMRFIDAGGAEVASADDVTRITRVEVVARSSRVGGLSGDAALRDAQGVTVRLRNR